MNILLSVICIAVAAILFYEGVAARNTIGKLMAKRYIVNNKLFNQKAYLREFVMPDQPAIQDIAKTLKGNTDLDTVINTYNWLENNYHYVTDNQILYNGKQLIWIGNDDTWNLPVLSLAIKKRSGFYGDCEDGSFLLESLLRANNINAYVNLGTVSIKGNLYGHAWCTFIYNGQECLLETTLGEPFDKPRLVPDIYRPSFKFNEHTVYAITGAKIDDITIYPPLPKEGITELKKILNES